MLAASGRFAKPAKKDGRGFLTPGRFRNQN
jgi:hypothetical protein